MLGMLRTSNSRSGQHFFDGRRAVHLLVALRTTGERAALTIAVERAVVAGAVVEHMPLVEGLSALGECARVPVVRAAPAGLLTGEEAVAAGSLLQKSLHVGVVQAAIGVQAEERADSWHVASEAKELRSKPGLLVVLMNC